MSKVTGILLAAGASTRMRGESKQLRLLSGVPLVRFTAQALLRGGLSPLIVVVPPGNDALASALAGLNVKLVPNHLYEEGMASSIAAGIERVPQNASGVAIALADMPAVRPATVKLLIERYAGTDRGIVYPAYRGQRGHPVLFDPGKYGDSLRRLTGDAGARTLIGENPHDLFQVDVDDPGVILDLDTPEDFEAYQESRDRHEERP